MKSLSVEGSRKNLRLFTNRQLNQIRRGLCWALKIGVYLVQKSDDTINRRLAAWLLWCLAPSVPTNEKPKRGVYTKDVVIDHVNSVWVRVFVLVEEKANEREELTVVVYFHSGGFCILSAAQQLYDEFCRQLAKRRRVVVVSVDYRLAPEHKFPAAYDDSYAALTWLKSHTCRSFLPCNADVSRCFSWETAREKTLFITSDAAWQRTWMICTLLELWATCFFRPILAARKERLRSSEINLTNVPLITVGYSDWFWRAFFPLGVTRDHPAANVTGPNCLDILAVQLPPSLVVISGMDILRDRQLQYLEHLKKIKKEAQLLFYKNAFHCFFSMRYHLSSQMTSLIL